MFGDVTGDIAGLFDTVFGLPVVPYVTVKGEFGCGVGDEGERTGAEYGYEFDGVYVDGLTVLPPKAFNTLPQKELSPVGCVIGGVDETGFSVGGLDELDCGCGVGFTVGDVFGFG